MHNSGECGCGCHSQQGSAKAFQHQGGDCCSSGHAHRRFYSKEETIKQFQDYLEQLQLEVKGVEEYINQLKKGETKR
jgi:hypothetical protein